MPVDGHSSRTPFQGWRASWAIFALALGVRVAYIFQIGDSPLFAQPAVDAETYVAHADRLAEGNWLGKGEGAFWQPPLYPYFLGLVRLLCPDSFFYAARIAQALMGALSCLLVCWLGQHLFHRSVGLSAGLATALYGPLIFFDGELLPASLATFLDLVGLPLEKGIVRPSEKSAFFMGRSWEYIREQPFAYLGDLAHKTFRFWHGDEIGRNQAIYFWRNYSFLLSALLWKKGLAFPFGLVAPLALWGLLLSVRQQGFTLPAVFVAAYAMGVIAFFPAARYRVPAVPVLLVFAAYGGCYLYNCAAARQWRSAGLGLAACLVFALPAN